MFEQHVLADKSEFAYIDYDGERSELGPVCRRLSVEQRDRGIVRDAGRFLGRADAHKHATAIMRHLTEPPAVAVKREDADLLQMMFAQAAIARGAAPEAPPVEEPPFPTPAMVVGVRFDALIKRATIGVLVACPMIRRLFTLVDAHLVSMATGDAHRMGGEQRVGEGLKFRLAFGKKRRIDVCATDYHATVTVHNFSLGEWATVDEALTVFDQFGVLAKRYESLTVMYAPRLRNDEMDAFMYVMMTHRYVRYVHPDRRVAELDRNRQFFMWDRAFKIVGSDRPVFKSTLCCKREADYMVHVLNELVGTAIKHKEALACLFDENNVLRRENRSQLSKLTLDMLRTVRDLFGANYAKVVQRPSQPVRWDSREQFVEAMEREYGLPMAEILQLESARVGSPVLVDDFLIWFPPDDPSLYGCAPVNARLHKLCYPWVKRKRLANGVQTIGCLKGPRRPQAEHHVTTYIVGPNKRLELHQNGQAEEYLVSVCAGLARVAMGAARLCDMLCDPDSLEARVAAALPLWSLDARLALAIEMRRGEWRARWHTVERVFGLAVAFARDVHALNSKLVDVDAHPTPFAAYVLVKPIGDAFEVYHLDTAVIHRQGPLVDFLHDIAHFIS